MNKAKNFYFTSNGIRGNCPEANETSPQGLPCIFITASAKYLPGAKERVA